MSAVDCRVRARSWDEIGRLTDKLRGQFGLTNEPYFPIMRFVEQVLDHALGWVQLHIDDYNGMDGAEGLTDPGGKFIIIRDDVYEAAWEGKGRPRFTVAHELGHWVMHTNVPFARLERSDDVQPYMRSEPQANQFAAELLMPRDFICAADTPHTVAVRHGVSTDAANNRLKFLRGKGII